MKFKFHIEDATLMADVRNEYGIEVENVHFIPLGDSAYSYRVGSVNGGWYHLKLFHHQNDRQREGIERLAYYIPLTWKMYSEGLFRNIAYPIKNQSGKLVTTLSDFTLVLFNFIEGETLAEFYPFSTEILVDIAKSVAEIQRITTYIEPAMLLTESFDISFEGDLEKCIHMLACTLTGDSPIKHSLREHIVPRKEQILNLLNLIRELRRIAIVNPKEKVLCHGDLWGGNMIRHGNTLYFIDWESAIFAPPEYDLMGYIGENFEVFYASYEEHLGCSVPINLDLLRFYSYRHLLRNLTHWLMNILYRNTEAAQSQHDFEMILFHCTNRWDTVEANVQAVDAILRRRNNIGERLVTKAVPQRNTHES